MELHPLMIRAAALVGAIYGAFLVIFFLGFVVGRRGPDWARIFSISFIVIILIAVLALPPLALTIFVAVLAFLGVREIWYASGFKNVAYVHPVFYAFTAIVSVLIPFLLQFRPSWFHPFAILVLAGLFSIPVFLRDVHLAFDRIARSMACIILSILFSHLVLLRALPAGLALCVTVIFLTNLADTSGYFFGKLLRGRRKMIEAVSPGKTLAGCLSSIPATLLLSLLFRWQLFPSVPVWYVLLMALVINAGAQIGDLIFSVFKRDVGIKDYSQLIPGHGGILDRFDSLVATAPLVYCFVTILPWPVAA